MIDVTEKPKVLVFVSHPWRTRSHPDPDGHDWEIVQKWFWVTIITVVDALWVLLYTGISSNELRLLESSSFSLEKHPKSGSIEAKLLTSLIQCVLDDAEMLGSAYLDLSHLERYTMAGRNVSVWFDFVCLPQSPRSCEEDVIFRKTLRNLSTLQRQMHTLIVTQDCGFRNRAWCVAEWLNCDSSTAIHVEGEVFMF